MLSTGNDIVSLAHINTLRTKEKRFYDKILTPSEVELYNSGETAELPFENFVWLAWSIKEAAFKYQSRSMSDLVFSPLKINIQSVTFPGNNAIKNFGCLQYEAKSFPEKFTFQGTVRCGPALFHFRSVVHHELIYTVANTDQSFGDVWWGIKTIGSSDHQHQSAAARSFLLNRLHAVLPDRKLEIGKTAAGCPVILDEGTELDLPVSFTHHHNFVAYSFVLSNPLRHTEIQATVIKDSLNA